MFVLKEGDKGSLVKAIQKKLKLEETGYFGSAMKVAVKEYQKSKGLSDDGKIGDKTFKALGITNPESYLSTDVSNLSQNTLTSQSTLGASKVTKDGSLKINELLLDKDEYSTDINEKEWLFIHHTAGGHDPYAVVKSWNNDARGRIATAYTIGGLSVKGDAIYDGTIVRCMPSGAWAYHLGDNGNKNLHPKSIGIEVCNFGTLSLGGWKRKGVWVEGDKDRFYTYVGSVVPKDQVCDLGFEFNGFRYFHKYTEAQIESLRLLILSIASAHPKINIKKGLQEWLLKETPAEAFGFKQEAYTGKAKGLLTHTNVRRDKTDMSPQPDLVAMILSL